MNQKFQSILDTLLKTPDENIDDVFNLIEPFIHASVKYITRVGLNQGDFEWMKDLADFTKVVLGEYSKSILVNVPNGVFAVDPEDCVVGLNMRYFGIWGGEELDIILKLVNPLDNVLIVGAHIGTLAIPVSRRVNRLVAIEANPQSFGLLNLNLKLNDISNCKAMNVAASNNTTEIKFRMNRLNSGGSKRKPLKDNYMYHYDDPEEITVKGVVLDNILDNNFDTIIMDLEGSEYFAMKGMKKILSHANALVIEFVPHHLTNVAGIDVSTFLKPVSEFKYMTIPSLNRTRILNQDDCFQENLHFMYEKGICDNLIFEKN